MTSTKTTNSPSALLHLFGGLLLIACLWFGVRTAQAQAVDMPPDMVAPPRLAVSEGQVKFLRPDSDGWEDAQVNTALAVGDTVQTGAGGTIELQIGPRDFARATANTALTLVAHDPGLMQIQVAGGLASFDLRGTRAGQLVRIDTPNSSLVIGGKGYYRVYVREGETRIAVRQGGRATINLANGRARSISAGEEVIIQGDDGRQQIDGNPVPPLDSWDRWNDARSDYYVQATSNRYVPTDVYGAADLDQHGRWREEGDYGWIWVPSVASGWAPYSTGNWQRDPIYGWTWIDAAPWGWTTSHYGRWVFVNGYWAWAPGPRTAHVAYAPALVAFYGASSGVGWVALGWGEPLLPWWGRPGFRDTPWYAGWGGPRVHHDNDYVYRNRSVHNAMIGVREEEFGRRHVRGSTIVVPLGPESRPIRGDHPIWQAPPNRGPSSRPDNREPRRDAMPPQRGAQSQPDRRPDQPQQRPPMPQREQPAPQWRAGPEPERNAPRQQVIIPARPVEVAPRPQIIVPAPRPAEPMPPVREQRNIVEPQRPRPEFRPESRPESRPEPRIEQRPAPAMQQPRISAPAPAIAAPAPAPVPQRGWRQDNGGQPQMRQETPSAPAVQPREQRGWRQDNGGQPQMRQETPSAPAAQPREQRDQPDRRGGRFGRPGERD